VQRAVEFGDVDANPGADLRSAGAVLGGVDVAAADDLLGAGPEQREREAVRSAKSRACFSKSRRLASSDMPSTGGHPQDSKPGVARMCAMLEVHAA